MNWRKENIFLLLLSGNINVVMIVRFITATSAQLSQREILSCFYTVLHHCALFILIHHILEEFAITLFTLYINSRKYRSIWYTSQVRKYYAEGQGILSPKIQCCWLDATFVWHPVLSQIHCAVQVKMSVIVVLYISCQLIRDVWHDIGWHGADTGWHCNPTLSPLDTGHIHCIVTHWDTTTVHWNSF